MNTRIILQECAQPRVLNQALKQCHRELNGKKAVGMDEVTKEKYSEALDSNIETRLEGRTMNPGLYYHILQIGATYEKGHKRGKLWQCALWRKLINYAELEYKHVNCSEKCFSDLRCICKRYDLPNYIMIIERQDELVASSNRISVDIDEREIIVNRILELISEIEASIKRINGKADAYRAVERIHNLPRALHGIDALGGFPPLSPKEAIKYSEDTL